MSAAVDAVPSVDQMSTIGMEILRTKFDGIVQEMAATVANSAPTREIGVGGDYAVAIADRQGAVAAVSSALHVGSLDAAVREVANYFKFDQHEGDVIVLSDPHRGGTHVQDWTAVLPVFADNTLLLNLVARAHVPDIGGRFPGSYNPGAREVLAEGVPISPIKLQRYGRTARDVVTTLMLNSREPEATRRVVDGLIAALSLGAARLHELIALQGASEVRAGLEYAQQYGERRARAEVARWTDGRYSATHVLRIGLADVPPVEVAVTATVEGDALKLDFTDSSPQSASFVNSPRGNTLSFAALPLLCAMGGDVPPSSGVLRSVVVVTRPGTVVDPEPGAPTGWCMQHCGAEIVHVVTKALRDAMPEPLPDLVGPTFHVTGRSVSAEFSERGWLDFSVWAAPGAAAVGGNDGWGRPVVNAVGTLPSVEQWEVDGSGRVHRLELVPDTGGIGERRGALGVEVELDLDPEWRYTICMAGRDNADSTSAGAPARALARDDSGREWAVSDAVDVSLGATRLVLRSAGGAGMGDAAQRDHGRVAADVRDGYITGEHARAVYSFDIDAESEQA